MDSSLETMPGPNRKDTVEKNDALGLGRLGGNPKETTAEIQFDNATEIVKGGFTGPPVRGKEKRGAR